MAYSPVGNQIIEGTAATPDAFNARYGASYVIPSVASGVTGDAATDDRAALNTLANTTISASGGVIECVGPATVLVNSNLTFPANVTLRVHHGFKFKPASGVTVTFNGPIEAGPHAWLDLSSGGGAVLGRRAQNPAYPEWWGCTGDGVTDDTTAWGRMITTINASGSCNLDLGSGTFLLAQTVANAAQFTSSSASFKLLDGVRIVGHGATLKTTEGLTFSTTSIVGWGMFFAGCSNVEIEGIEGDGSAETFTYPTPAYEGASQGLAFYACKGVTVRRVNFHGYSTDCLYICDDQGNGCGGILTVGTQSEAIDIGGSRFTQGRRQAVMPVSVNGCNIHGCYFDEGGWEDVPGGDALTWAATMDVEPNINNIGIYGLVFSGCYFGKATRASVIAAGTQSKVYSCSFEQCTFENTRNMALVISSPRMDFNHCTVLGEVSMYCRSFTNGQITTDDDHYGTPSTSIAALWGNDNPTRIENVDIYVNRANDSRAFYVSGSTVAATRKLLRDVRIHLVGNGIPDNAYCAYATGACVLDRVTVQHTGTAPATKYTVYATSDPTSDIQPILRNCYSDNAKILFYPAGTAQTSLLWERDASLQLQRLKIQNSPTTPTSAFNVLGARSTTPSALAGAVNDWYYAIDAASAETGTVGSKYCIHGWRCTSAGTAGAATWLEQHLPTGN